MCIKVLDKKVLSSNGKNMLSGKVYLPDGDVKGYFHVVHGMTEHIARYDSFMSLMAEKDTSRLDMIILDTVTPQRMIPSLALLQNETVTICSLRTSRCFMML